jgi:hypothetical protein
MSAVSNEEKREREVKRGNESGKEEKNLPRRSTAIGIGCSGYGERSQSQIVRKLF